MLDFNLVPLLPEIFLAIVAMGLLMIGTFQGNRSVKVVSWFAVAGLAFSLFIMGGLDFDTGPVLGGMFQFSLFDSVVKSFIILGSAASIALSVRYLYDENMVRFEYPVLVLMATIGMLLMVSSYHFLSLYVALELQALSLYVLAAFRRGGLRSSEAGVKYFTLGALSSGLLLFGISLIYGASGGLDFDTVRGVASSVSALFSSAGSGAETGKSLLFLVGMVFVIAGLAFKLSAAPFHMWTPDVYQGAPSAVTAFFAIVPKLAAAAVLIKLLVGPFYALAQQWQQIIYGLALLSMLVGAFAGLAQTNIKRLMAYSSIGNMGYALLGVVAATPQGISATLLYSVLYMFMTIGAFAVVLSMRRGDLMVVRIADFSGLSRTNPFFAYSFALILFSMSGIPPLSGFFGKLAVFDAAMASGLYWLAVLGVLSSVIAAFYYLRIIKVMFFDPADESINRAVPLARYVVLGVSLFVALFFIFKPAPLMTLTERAAHSLFVS